MWRALLGLLTAVFLSFVGLQAAHAHGDERQAPRGCCVCAIGAKSVRALPAAAPATAPAALWTELAPAPDSLPLLARSREAAARSPPAA